MEENLGSSTFGLEKPQSAAQHDREQLETGKQCVRSLGKCFYYKAIGVESSQGG